MMKVSRFAIDNNGFKGLSWPGFPALLKYSQSRLIRPKNMGIFAINPEV